MALHPQIVERTCGACKQWMFDGEHRRIMRRGQPAPRPANTPLPCFECVKQDTATGRRLDAAWPRIARMIERHAELRATHGQSLSEIERNDAAFVRSLALVDTALRQLSLDCAMRDSAHSANERRTPHGRARNSASQAFRAP